MHLRRYFCAKILRDEYTPWLVTRWQSLDDFTCHLNGRIFFQSRPLTKYTGSCSKYYLAINKVGIIFVPWNSILQFCFLWVPFFSADKITYKIEHYYLNVTKNTKRTKKNFRTDACCLLPQQIYNVLSSPLAPLCCFFLRFVRPDTGRYCNTAVSV